MKTLFFLLAFVYASLATAKGSFTDKDLAAHMKRNSKGVIFVLSPHMYLSLKALPEYRAASAKAKVSFLPLLDPVTNTRNNLLKTDLKKIEVLNSEVLIKKNALLHFPSFIFFKDGKLQEHFNPGYDSPEKFEHRLKEFF